MKKALKHAQQNKIAPAGNARSFEVEAGEGSGRPPARLPPLAMNDLKAAQRPLQPRAAQQPAQQPAPQTVHSRSRCHSRCHSRSRWWAGSA
jgi:hypothetical protein